MRHWEIVERVRQHFRKDCNTTLAACKAAKVSRTLYYNAMKDPYVQQQLAEERAARQQITHDILNASWGATMMNMAKIAANPRQPREAVAAARLLYQMAQDEDRVAEQAGPTDERHPASEIVDRFLHGTPARVVLRETTRTREVDLGSPDFPSEIVDVTPEKP